MRWVAGFLWLLLFAGGCVLEDQPVDPGFDAGPDSGLCGGCSADKPVCSSSMECVECTLDDTRYCTERMLVCDPAASECVQCVDSASCTDPGASRCNTELHQCEACQNDDDCAGIDGLGVCDADACVECTPDTEAADCNGTSCNPRTRTCTETVLGSREVCESCVSDSDCGLNGSPSADHRCVEMEYAGERFPDELTGFCLKVFLPGGCEQPYAIRISDRPSLSGEPLRSYCGIKELLATCPAVRALDSNTTCGQDTDCPESGLCQAVGGLADRCTYRCSDETHCDKPGNPGSTCGSSGAGGDAYCGG